MSSTENPRRLSYKSNNNLDPQELKRKLEDDSIELRKRKRDEEVERRRNLADDVPDPDLETTGDSSECKQKDEEDKMFASEVDMDFFEEETLTPKTFSCILSSNPDHQSKGIEHIVKIMSNFLRLETSMDQLFEEEKVVHQILSLMTNSEKQEIRIKSSVILARLSLSPVKYLMRLLESLNILGIIRTNLEEEKCPPPVPETCVYILGNLLTVVTSSAFRMNTKLQETFIEEILILIPILCNLGVNAKSSPVMIRNTVWTLSRISQSMGCVTSDTDVTRVTSVVKKRIFEVDSEIISDCLVCLSGICKGSPTRIQFILQSDLAGRIVALLTHSNQRVVLSALKVIGVIASGTEAQTQVLVDLGILGMFHSMLTKSPTDETASTAASFLKQDKQPPKTTTFISPSDEVDMKRQICWIISNVTAGTQSQVEAVKKCNLFPILRRLMDVDSDFRVRKEAVFCIKNATCCGSIDQVQYLADEVGVIEPLCRCLDYNDLKMTMNSLVSLENILQAGHWIAKKKGGNHLNPYVIRIENSFGLEKIEMLQIRDNEEIVDKAIGITTRFFGDKKPVEESHFSNFWFHLNSKKSEDEQERQGKRKGQGL